MALNLQAVRRGLPNTDAPFSQALATGFGTPKAVINFGGRNADSVRQAFSGYSIGFGDGVTRSLLSGQNVNNVSTTGGATRSFHKSSDFGAKQPNNTTDWYYRGFTAFSADSLDFDYLNSWDPQLSTHLLQSFAIGGDDVVNAVSGQMVGQQAAVDIDLGFVPDIVLFQVCSLNTSATNNTAYGPSATRLGVLINKADKQRSFNYSTPFSETTSKSRIYLGNAEIGYVAQNDNSGPRYAFAGSILSGATDGFRVVGNDPDCANQNIFYLALKLAPGVDYDLVDIEIPMAGNYVQTGVGFQPSAMIMAVSANNTVNALSTTSDRGCTYCIASDIDGPKAYSQTWYDVDGVGTTICYQSSYPSLAAQWHNGGTNYELYQYTFAGFDADGWTYTRILNNSVIPLKGWALAIGPGGAPTDKRGVILGSTTINEMNLGNTPINQAYIGSTEIFN